MNSTWYFWEIVNKNWYVLTDTFCDPDKKIDKFQENQKTSNTKTDTFYFFIQNPSNGESFEWYKS